MPICCRCSGKGQCKNCSCTRSRISCIDCIPSRSGRCQNTNHQQSEIRVEDDIRENSENIPHRNLSEAPIITTSTLPTFEEIGPPNFTWGETVRKSRALLTKHTMKSSTGDPTLSRFLRENQVRSLSTR